MYSKKKTSYIERVQTRSYNLGVKIECRDDAALNNLSACFTFFKFLGNVFKFQASVFLWGNRVTNGLYGGKINEVIIHIVIPEKAGNLGCSGTKQCRLWFNFEV